MCFTNKQMQLINSLEWINEPGERKSGQRPQSCKTYFLHGKGKEDKYEITLFEDDAKLILKTIGERFNFQFSFVGNNEGAIKLIDGNNHSINVYNKRKKDGSTKTQYRISCVPFGRFFEKKVGEFFHYYFDVVTMDGSVVLMPTGERDRNDSK